MPSDDVTNSVIDWMRAQEVANRNLFSDAGATNALMFALAVQEAEAAHKRIADLESQLAAANRRARIAEAQAEAAKSVCSARMPKCPEDADDTYTNGWWDCTCDVENAMSTARARVEAELAGEQKEAQ